MLDRDWQEQAQAADEMVALLDRVLEPMLVDPTKRERGYHEMQQADGERIFGR